jgi:hypothetical protein
MELLKQVEMHRAVNMLEPMMSRATSKAVPTTVKLTEKIMHESESESPTEVSFIAA